MSHPVSQRSQRLDVAYSILRELVRESIGHDNTDFHVLSAAADLTHRALLQSEQLDREKARAAADPVDNSA